MPALYRVALTPTARSMLSAIKHRPIQEQIQDRSVRATAQRYRIIYRVQQNRLEVLVVAIGLRREGDREDVYRLAKRLLRLRLLG